MILERKESLPFFPIRLYVNNIFEDWEITMEMERG
jgi:hypothetical protein